MENNPIVLIKNRIDFEPFVSVIIPVYNVAPYLQECLDSIRKQSLYNIEIICINDGSTDDSLSILQQNAKEDSRISVLTQKNVGLSATRNVGVKNACGQYIYFMDSDDMLKLHALREMYEIAQERELDIIYCDGSSFSNDSEYNEQALKYSEYYKRKRCYDGVRTGATMMKDMLAEEEYRVSACLQMMRRKFFVQNALWFYEGILHEDNLFTFSSMLKALRVSHVNECLFSRRVREGSIVTGKVTFSHVYGYFCCYIEMEKFLEGLNLLAEEENAALEILKRVLHNARNLYMQISEEDKQAVGSLSRHQEKIFEFLVTDVSNALLAVKAKNEILQITYREKSDINRKLKEAYKDKRERGDKIKELQALVSKQRTEIQELSVYKNSRAYKVGSIIMYFPGKVIKVIKSIRNRIKLNT